jgi:hypothetical protein
VARAAKPRPGPETGLESRDPEKGHHRTPGMTRCDSCGRTDALLYTVHDKLADRMVAACPDHKPKTKPGGKT